MFLKLELPGVFPFLETIHFLQNITEVVLNSSENCIRGFMVLMCLCTGDDTFVHLVKIVPAYLFVVVFVIPATWEPG